MATEPGTNDVPKNMNRYISTINVGLKILTSKFDEVRDLSSKYLQH